jgi:hypothetical protein
MALVGINPPNQITGNGPNPQTNMGNSGEKYGDIANNGVAVGSLNAATNATPIAVTFTAPHNLVTGQIVNITGVTGNTAANGKFTVTVTSTTQATLNGSAGNGAYVAGGTVTTGTFAENPAPASVTAPIPATP